MRKMRYLTLNLLSVLLLFAVSLEARSFRVAQIPNGSENNCANCHVNPAGGGTRTSFGLLVEANLVAGNVEWGSTLSSADSDGDGFSNGHELEDPFGTWAIGASAPGDPSSVSNPGVDSSLPPTEAQLFSLHFAASNMDPHVGQYFQVRVENSSTSEQVAAAELTAITENAFDFTFMHGLESGQSYTVELWSDHNGNGVYDAPPTDHAWRVELTNITGNHSEAFAHNTNFTDIGSPVALDVQIELPSIMTLHDNYPNPFNPSTLLSFSLVEAGSANLSIFDIRGQLVATIFDGTANAGTHHFSFEGLNSAGANLEAGLYFYRLETQGMVTTKRMTLIK